MNNNRYRFILYLILVVIVGTVAIQFYWNYKNYLTNRDQLINDVQLSLDNAVESYYTELAEKSAIGLTMKDAFPSDLIIGDVLLDSLPERFKLSAKRWPDDDSLELEVHDGSHIYNGPGVDSILRIIHDLESDTARMHQRLMIRDYSFETDSMAVDHFKSLTSKVIISLTQDSLNLKDIDSLFSVELERKQIAINYKLTFRNQFDPEDNIVKGAEDALVTYSKSSFLPSDQLIQVTFSNETREVLKRSMTGIAISFVLVLLVISCLFYLLNIIKRQKQLSEVKNDLISNITHEFKTPIATIGVALESIKNFDTLEDKERTRTYLDTSEKQLKKLNTMVEKILETASLDSDSLILDKQEMNLSEMLRNLITRYEINGNEKTISANLGKEDLKIHADAFHLENAINNIMDNAVKYGGDQINILARSGNNNIVIEITDNGKGLSHVNKDRIFDKFYRVPKGNTHDVKGFGIGLYYTKTIIEKHKGTVSLNLDDRGTTFKMTIPE